MDSGPPRPVVARSLTRELGAEVFEPVLLDLSDDRDLFVITVALGEFALEVERWPDKGAEWERVCGSDGNPEGMRALADRAYVLLGDIEHQVARNGIARGERED